MLWVTRSKVLLVRDGDTLVVNSDMGRSIFHQAEIRLLGVGAPELSQLGGPETRIYLRNWVDAHAALADGWVLVTTYKNRNDRDVQSFNRWLGTVSSMDSSHVANVDVQAFIDANGYGAGS